MPIDTKPLREPLLKQADVEFMKSLETGSSTVEIVAEKQRLRDITKEVDKANISRKIFEIKIESEWD